MKKYLIRISPVALFSMLGLFGCGGGSSGGGAAPPPPPPPPVAASAAGIWTGQAVTPDIPDIVTGFEFDDANGFVIGNAPYTADFQGGVAESRGIGALYADGLFSWHVAAAVAGTVTFATPGSTMSFSTRTVTAGDNATIQVLDENGTEILLTAVPGAFTQISVARGAGESLIGSVIVTVATGEIVIDAFTFGYPSTASIDDLGCLVAPNDEFVCVVSDAITDDIISAASGTVQVNGNQVTGSGNIYAAPGEILPNGSTIAALTISAGTVAQNTSLDVTIVSAGLSIAVTSTFDASYNRGSSLATVAAMYTTFDLLGDASSFDIDVAGVISGQTVTGCVLSGQVSIIDAAANAYDVNLVADAATCGALAGDYNGLGSSQDENVMDDVFVFGVDIDGQSMIVGEAVK